MMSSKKGGDTQKRAKKGTSNGGQWVKNDIPASIAGNKAATDAYIAIKDFTAARVKMWKTQNQIKTATGEKKAALKARYKAEKAVVSNLQAKRKRLISEARKQGYKMTVAGKVISTPSGKAKTPAKAAKTPPVAQKKPVEPIPPKQAKKPVVPAPAAHTAKPSVSASPRKQALADKIVPPKSLSKMSQAEFNKAVLESPMVKEVFDGEIDSLPENGLIGGSHRKRVLDNAHAAMGFSETPKLVDSVSKGGDVARVMYRGLADNKNGGKGADYAHEFKTGKLYVGNGIYGDGTYLTSSKRAAEEYSKGTSNSGVVMKIGIPKSYKVVSYTDLMSKVNGMGGNKWIDNNRTRKLIRLFENDPELAAMALGYDGIKITQSMRNDLEKSTYYNVFNRTDLLVEK